MIRPLGIDTTTGKQVLLPEQQSETKTFNTTAVTGGTVSIAFSSDIHKDEFDVCTSGGLNITNDSRLKREWQGNNYILTFAGGWPEGSWVLKPHISINNISGGGGTTDYTQLTNKPSINGVTLNGNKTASDINVVSNESLPDEILSSATFTPKVLGYYQYTVSAGDVVTFNAPTSGKMQFDLDIIEPDPVVSFTWGQEIEWQGGVTPSFTSPGTIKLQFSYVNGSWRGYCRPDMSQYVAKSGENFVDYTNFKITSRSYYDQFARTVIGFTSDGSALMLGDNVRTNYVSVITYANWITGYCSNHRLDVYNNLYINANVQKIYLNNHIANTAGGFCISDATTGLIASPGDVTCKDTDGTTTISMRDLAARIAALEG